MGTENPNHANAYPRPAASPFAAPQSTTPFLSSRPVVGSEASPFRPTSVPAPMSTMPFRSSAPMVGSEVPGFRPTQPSPRPPSFGPPATGPFQRSPAPQYHLTGQVPPPPSSSMGQPVFPPSVRPPGSQFPSMTGFQSRPAQIPSVPMGSPPQSMNSVPLSNNAPQSSIDSSFFPRTNMQQPSPPMAPSYPGSIRGTPPPPLPGYPNIQANSVSQPPPVQAATFLSHRGGYVPPQSAVSAPFPSHQGGYAPAPPVAPPLGMYTGGIQHQGSAPPTGSLQGLVEDFSSISLGSVPGSFDAGLDSKELPRPLDGDVEPSSYTEMYPMNCNSRYLRLTTSAIPNSQSLASRWHLPLGAVVCPLAEAPEGEEVPVINFATTGIVRCRRCRTYVNPYVTFTDGGRKWRCNICALLNDGKASNYFKKNLFIF